MKTNDLRDRWVNNGQLTEEACAFFRLAGREIEQIPLSDAAATAHFWLNEPKQDRWCLTNSDQSVLDELTDRAKGLGMVDPWLRDKNEPATEMVIVLPGEYPEMVSAMLFAIREMRGFCQLITLSSTRPATPLELRILASHKLVPPCSSTATQSTMARLALCKAMFSDNVQMTANLTYKFIDGAPPTLEQMVSKFMESFEDGGQITFAFSQPNIHQAIVTERALKYCGFSGSTNYICVDPTVTIGRPDRMPDLNYVISLLDEGCRVIKALISLERVDA